MTKAKGRTESVNTHRVIRTQGNRWVNKPVQQLKINKIQEVKLKHDARV